MYIYKNTKWNSERQFQKHFNPIEYVQCPEFSTTPAVIISGTTSTIYIYIYIYSIVFLDVGMPLLESKLLSLLIIYLLLLLFIIIYWLLLILITAYQHPKILY